jgi:hypothetical protein
MDTCPRCDLKRHRACICGKVKKDRLLRGATVDRHVGKRLSRLEPITIATECSGIEAPIIALRRMGINHTHVYSTECNESARVWSVYNYSPLTRYDDVTRRDPSSLPRVDIYVCGIPCQDFSVLNQQRSSENVKCESVAMSVLEGIATSLPDLCRRALLLRTFHPFDSIDCLLAFMMLYRASMTCSQTYCHHISMVHLNTGSVCISWGYGKGLLSTNLCGQRLFLYK